MAVHGASKYSVRNAYQHDMSTTKSNHYGKGRTLADCVTSVFPPVLVAVLMAFTVTVRLASVSGGPCSGRVVVILSESASGLAGAGTSGTVSEKHGNVR